MSRHIDDKDVEILPPSRDIATRVPAVQVSAAPPAPYRHDPGGIISGVPKRWVADSQARTYESYSRRSIAERALVEADTSLGKSLIDNMRMRQEYSELPATLVADRTMRQLRRSGELRELCHQIEMQEARRLKERSAAELDLVKARRVLVDAEQELEAQRRHGLQYHSLLWSERIGEAQMRVEEQQAILAEHRGRGGQSSARLDVLLGMRTELAADGEDTAAIDLAIERLKAGRTRRD